MTDRSASPPIPIVSAISPLLGGVEAWICDIWGVVHNGLAAFEPAVAACTAFRARGGVVLLLTNAPRPAAAIHEQLARLKVPPAAFDAVLTSGDLTLSLIARHRDEPMLHLGPDRDRGLFARLSPRFVPAAEARVIVCSGLYDDERDTPEDYRCDLEGPASRGVPMICANPDLTVARGDRIIPCAGAVAALYESLGGPVVYAGKPHLPVYDRALEMLAGLRGRPVAKAAVLAIGDGVHTDMAGAANAGLRSVFVASPVHLKEPLDERSLARLFAGSAVPPVAAMHALAW